MPHELLLIASLADSPGARESAVRNSFERVLRPETIRVVTSGPISVAIAQFGSRPSDVAVVHTSHDALTLGVCVHDETVALIQDHAPKLGTFGSEHAAVSVAIEGERNRCSVRNDGLGYIPAFFAELPQGKFL